MARRRYEGARPPALFLPLRPLVFLSATCTMLSFAALVLAVDPVGLKDAASTAIGRTDAAERGQCKRLHVERPSRSWPWWHCHSPGTSGNGRLGNYSQQKMVPTLMGLPILLRRLDPCATLWASCAALGHGLTAIAAHAGEVRRAFADSDRGARRRQTDRRHRPVVRRLQRAGDGGPLTRSRDRARRHAPWAPRLTAGENSPRNCGRPAVRCSGIVALRTRFSFWPRYCKLSTAGSKTGNLESLLT
jgi:hypothetical protein